VHAASAIRHGDLGERSVAEIGSDRKFPEARPVRRGKLGNASGSDVERNVKS
jgi:hypothetical protein